MANSNDNFPEELKESVSDFHQGLQNSESILRQFIEEKPDLEQLSPDERARVELVSAFALNSLVWVSLRTKGVNPKDTQLKDELDRVKKGMLRLKEIKDKARRGKINLPAAKRFIKAGIGKSAKDMN
uniref:Nuclear nucleic acid-binding protein C1D n=1 Tax=Caligus rogercresseyi TaxID=217165 RepID=C1BR28_CALRO|nr:Nuclear nucleic acid-binding protein C1D [Caligus rogercresseyi]|eukprot:TRINITY_DN5489_c0_g1_i2.p1 TRINITY_DN5489_c0_g1~~TRINITY_DN5489_c0_g1_i2.p1  ORF type:complete len:127 (+),score=37.52 TRINITY_DN5489_c0_g1_i2:117-497(+)